MSVKIYIAGKITGDPNYKAKFEAAAEEYKKKGYLVLNPSWMPKGMQPADYMRICFAMIDTADVVAFLPGYRTSPGAQLELQYCFYTDKTTHLPPEPFDENGEPTLEDYKKAYEQAVVQLNQIKKLNSCNNCRNVGICLHLPSEGEPVRINCPFWAKELPRSYYKKHTVRHTHFGPVIKEDKQNE